MKIVSRWDSDEVLWEGECDNVRDELVAAAKNGANLSRAYLSGANLNGANLSRAYLSRANLSRANLNGANLSGADLSGADLSGAYLTGAYLSRADLSGADLSGAYLNGAYLSGANLNGANLRVADLSGADLSGAYLSRAYLNGATGINPLRCTPLLMLLDQPGPIRAYKLVKADGVGPYNGGITYEIGGSYEVATACTDVNEHCAAGISLATLDWCMAEWQPGRRILVVEFEAGDIAAIPTATDGKFRVHRCRVVGEKDLVEIGLVDAKEQAGQ